MSVKHDLKTASIYMLSDDCLMHIFQFLSITDKFSAENVCTHWNMLVQKAWDKVTKIVDSTWGYSALQINTYILDDVFKKCGKFLKQFKIPNGIYLNTTVLEKISLFCPNLTHIDVSKIKIQIANLELFMKRCKHITNLIIQETEKCSHDNLAFLRECPELSHFEIYKNFHFTGQWLSQLPVKTMRTLVIKHCYINSDVTFALGLATLKNLEHLELDIIIDDILYPTKTLMRTFILETIGYHCTNLKKLLIHKLFAPLVLNSFKTLEFMNLVNLQMLKIVNFPFSNKHVISIVRNCIHITSLNISGEYTFIDSDSIRTITSLPKLEYLYVNDLTSSITDDSLENVKNLKEFECRNCHLLTDNGIYKILISSPQLRLLDITGCLGITKKTHYNIKTICANRSNKIIKIHVSSDFLSR